MNFHRQTTTQWLRANPGRMPRIRFPVASSPRFSDSRLCMSMPAVPRIDWSANGERLLVYSPGDAYGHSHIALCDAANGFRFIAIELQGGLVSAARIAVHDMRILIGLAEPHPQLGSFCQFDAESGTFTPLMNHGSSVAVTSVAASTDGRFAAAGTTAGVIHVFDPNRGIELWNFTGHQGPVTDLQISQDAELIASAGCDGVIGFWGTETGQQQCLLPGDAQPVSSLDLAPDGWRVVSGSVDGTIVLWDLTTGRRLWTAEADTTSVNSISISADGAHVASGGFGRRISVWDLNTGRKEFELPQQLAAVASLKFSPDGRWLGSTGYDGAVRIWDTTFGFAERMADCG